MADSLASRADIALSGARAEVGPDPSGRLPTLVLAGEPGVPVPDPTFIATAIEQLLEEWDPAEGVHPRDVSSSKDVVRGYSERFMVALRERLGASTALWRMPEGVRQIPGRSNLLLQVGDRFYSTGCIAGVLQWWKSPEYVAISPAGYWRDVLLGCSVDSEESRSRLYHGSRAGTLVEEFRARSVSHNSYGLLGNVEVERTGVFFTENATFARRYGSSVGEYEVSLAHVADVVRAREAYLDYLHKCRSDDPYSSELYSSVLYTSDDWALFDNTIGREFVQWLSSIGFDGARFEEELEEDGEVFQSTTTVIFDPRNIRLIGEVPDPKLQQGRDLRSGVGRPL